MVQINYFTEWLTDKRDQVFFVAGAIAGDSRHCKASGTQQAKFEPAQNLILGSDEWSCAVLIATAPRSHIAVFYYLLFMQCLISEFRDYNRSK